MLAIWGHSRLPGWYVLPETAIRLKTTPARYQRPSTQADDSRRLLHLPRGLLVARTSFASRARVLRSSLRIQHLPKHGRSPAQTTRASRSAAYRGSQRCHGVNGFMELWVARPGAALDPLFALGFHPLLDGVQGRQEEVLGVHVRVVAHPRREPRVHHPSRPVLNAPAAAYAHTTARTHDHYTQSNAKPRTDKKAWSLVGRRVKVGPVCVRAGTAPRIKAGGGGQREERDSTTSGSPKARWGGGGDSERDRDRRRPRPPRLDRLDSLAECAADAAAEEAAPAPSLPESASPPLPSPSPFSSPSPPPSLALLTDRRRDLRSRLRFLARFAASASAATSSSSATKSSRSEPLLSSPELPASE